MSFGSSSPKPPKEDPLVTMQRERSILDLAKLDEDENRRIKQLRSAGRGVRAFRAMRGASGDSMIGSVTSNAPSPAPGSTYSRPVTSPTAPGYNKFRGY